MNWWERNSNTVLTGLELVGFVGAIITTAMAAPKVKEKLDDIPKVRTKKVELVKGVYTDELEPIPVKERAVMIVRSVGRDCITPIIFSTVTISAMIGANRNCAAIQQAAIASSYTMAKRLYDENKEKVNAIMDDICPLDKDNPSALTGLEESRNGDPKDRKDIFFLEYSGRRFKSSIADVEEALELADEQFQKTGILSFNNLYLYLGIAESKLGVDNGVIDWFRLNNPEHQESEHLEWSLRAVTKDPETDPDKADDVIYMIELANSLETNLELYREIAAYEDDYSHSL